MIFKKIILPAFILLLIFIGILVVKKSPDTDTYKDPIFPNYENKIDEKPPIITVKVQTKKIDTISLPILMYHYVEFVRDPKDTIRKSLDVNPFIFEKQLKNIKENGLTTYFVRDIPDIFSGKIKDGGSNKIILTFDDGYEDFYTDAFPLLKKYNAKATIYIIYDFIGRRGFLNKAEIKELIASGLIEVGSHTLDHSFLKSASPEVAKKQIVDSKSLLEKTFGITVNTFAYPYGAFNQSDVKLVQDAGYIAAVTVARGTKQSDNNIFDLYRLRAGGYEGKNLK